MGLSQRDQTKHNTLLHLGAQSVKINVLVLLEIQRACVTPHQFSNLKFFSPTKML